MGISGAQPVNTGASSNAPKSAVKAATSASTASGSTPNNSSSSSGGSSQAAEKPRSMEILELIMDPKNAEKMSYGYDTPQEIAAWYQRKNQESQAAWMGYQGKQQTAAMLGQAISAGAGALGQMMAGMSKGAGNDRGGPGGAVASAAGKKGDCANGQCGGTAQVQQTQGGCAKGQCGKKTASTEEWTSKARAEQVASTNTNIAPEALTQKEAINEHASMAQVDFTNTTVDTPNIEIPPEPIQQPEPVQIDIGSVA
jgi:hypothetical protein